MLPRGGDSWSRQCLWPLVRLQDKRCEMSAGKSLSIIVVRCMNPPNCSSLLFFGRLDCTVQRIHSKHLLNKYNKHTIVLITIADHKLTCSKLWPALLLGQYLTFVQPIFIRSKIIHTTSNLISEEGHSRSSAVLFEAPHLLMAYWPASSMAPHTW